MLELAVASHIEQQQDTGSVEDPWVWQDDLFSDGDDNDVDDSIMHQLLDTYMQAASQRYTAPRGRKRRRQDHLVDLLDEYQHTDRKLFRGLVRMTPTAFEDLVTRLHQTRAFNAGQLERSEVREQVAVALYRFGRSGNGAGFRDIALHCGCSQGSVNNWTRRTIEALLEITPEVLTFATEDERSRSARWVSNHVDVPEWSRGWLVADGTHIPLAWKPALYHVDYFSYKHMYSCNIALVMLPHSLRIVESVVGHPGTSQDSRVWTSGSQILAKPRLHLDDGEFVWVDGGYGFSPFTVGPFTNKAADQSRDLSYFNRWLSRIRVRAEHGIAYLKNRFQLLKGYRGNMYRDEDHCTASKAIQACIVAHTFASRYDKPDDVADYLLEDYSESDVNEVLSDLQRYEQATEPARRTWQDNQAQYEADLAAATEGMSDTQRTQFRVDQARDLREEMLRALFNHHRREPEDTSVLSRRYERTIAAYNAMMERQTGSRARSTATSRSQTGRSQSTQNTNNVASRAQ
ncbi:uncharacterized protein UTRI_05957 [Ustilago trichophora]|uniref:DAD domain-containing protein n=1 Tax=Ustilago trichophora TaxID=86804 RepID=A0A5C3EHT4_9BASI|nr:uncharacterized protein UTRI_05957 [Ustilago trichophora]